MTPGSTIATWSTSSISTMRFIRTIESISAPSMAFAPPDSPVRAPWGTTGTRCLVAQRSTVWTCSVVRRPGHAQRAAGGAEARAVVPVAVAGGLVGDDGALGQQPPPARRSVCSLCRPLPVGATAPRPVSRIPGGPPTTPRFRTRSSSDTLATRPATSSSTTPATTSAGTPRCCASSSDAADDLAVERLRVELALPGDDGVGRTDGLVQAGVLGDEPEPGHEPCAQRGQPAAEPPGGAGALDRGEVDAVPLPVERPRAGPAVRSARRSAPARRPSAARRRRRRRGTASARRRRRAPRRGPPARRTGRTPRAPRRCRNRRRWWPSRRG